jgi:hypothetical protein
MQNVHTLAGDSKAANRRPQNTSTLRWHATPTRELLNAALKIDDADARYTLLMIVMVGNLHHPLPPVTNVKWWKGELRIPAQRWRRDLSTLINAQVVSVRDGLITTTFSHVCCNKVGSSEPKHRGISNGSPHVSVAVHVEDSSTRRYLPHERTHVGAHSPAYTHTPVRASDDVADDGWPGPNVVPLHGGVR